jgi:hypothetical protein
MSYMITHIHAYANPGATILTRSGRDVDLTGGVGQFEVGVAASMRDVQMLASAIAAA